MKKYIIKKELMGGDWYYMIYKRFIFWFVFWERWNTEESAKQRIEELRHPQSTILNY